MARRRNMQEWQNREEIPMDMPQSKHNEPVKYMSKVVAGQRWLSKMEPELGVGIVTKVDMRYITISFYTASLTRMYAIDTAPLKRVIFQPGDSIRTFDNKDVKVRSFVENDGVIVYKTDIGDIREDQISDSVPLSTPLDRLLGGQTDSIEDFNLRNDILDLRYEISKSPVRGWNGGRIELIPHQLYIAKKITSRHIRRFLLADEVGLGKTIEACLVFHNLIVNRMANRTLILLPESLIHVWFVELLRKFNTLFKIFDKDFFDSFQMENNNPFLSESLIISDINVVANSKQLQKYAIEAGWDLLIIDEAHHICESTDVYPFVKELSSRARDILLLSATPQQFGEINHFRLLKLLDPSRYESFEKFTEETLGYEKIANITGKLMENKVLNGQENSLLQALLPNAAKTSESSEQMVSQILDRHGTGRVMFRNTRLSVGGFPCRTVDIMPLEVSPEKCTEYNALYEKFVKQPGPVINLDDDPRIDVVVELLGKFRKEKFLLVCASTDVVLVDKAIQKKMRVKTAAFHEGLTLIQRDRNAAYFAEDDGARVLICSEIGSEGRNFQFLHHLIIFDLPPNPELVEQRIGRIDRIGQKGPIVIHVPFVKGGAHEVLARIFNEGLGIFENVVPAAQEAFEKYKAEVLGFCSMKFTDCNEFGTALDSLIAKIHNEVVDVSKRLHLGRDRLLEQYSFNREEGNELVSQIKKFEKDIHFVNVVSELLKNRGIYIEEITDKIYKLWADGELDELLPGLRNSRPVVTFDRTTAVHREDVEFFTPDHPAVLDGIDLFLGTETGNSSLAIWPSPGTPSLLLETVYVIECIVPQELNISRFLPPVPVRIVVDQFLKDKTKELSLGRKSLQECSSLPILDNDEIKNNLIPKMEQKCAELAKCKMDEIIRDAVRNVEESVGSEVMRLVALRETNKAISENEICAAKDEFEKLKSALSKASAALAAIRIIWKADV